MGQQNKGSNGQFSSRRLAPIQRLEHGLFVIDKPKGITSCEVVRRIRARTGIQHIGHTGTLDPLATGVLPICTGEATKLIPYFSGKRRYDGEFLLGTETDTQDITGNIICRKDTAHVPTSRIEEIFKAFIGDQHQLTPQFSAIKFRGKPAYHWARKGMVVPQKERCVQIETLHLLGRERQRVFFDLICSSGTYVRSIVSDIGRSLGCGACLTALRRLRCGSFPLEYSLPLDRLNSAIEDESDAPWFWPMIKLLPDFESVLVDEAMVRRLRNGMALPYNEVSLQNQISVESGRKFKIIYNNTIVALGEFRTWREQIMLHPIRILHTIR